MAMKNPPRRTTIRGQKHLLAYITPEEAALLKARGGSGELHNGIPSFPPSERDSSGREKSGGGFEGGGGGGGGSASDNQSDEDIDQSVQQDIAATAAAAQGVDLGGYQFDEGFDPTSRQTARDVYDTMMAIRTGASGLGDVQARNQIMGYVADQLQDRRNKARSLMSFPVTLFGKTYQVPSIIGSIGGLLSNFNLSNIENALQNPNAIPAFDVTGKLQGAYGPGMFGFGEVYTGNRPNQPTFDDGRGPDTVPATYNPNTGEQQCPDGYMFDEDLQACRLAGGLPGGDGKVMTTSGPYAEGDYARMGLLDVAPMGMGMFAQRYGAGFGTPQDFSTANLAFRRGAATRPQYFKQAPDLTGYTLLS